MATASWNWQPARRAGCLAALAAVVIVVAACAGQPTGSAGADRSPTATTTNDSPTGPTPTPSTSAGAGSRSPGLSSTDLPTLGRSGPPKLPNDQVQPVTVHGTVRVVGACTLLNTQGAVWSLVGVPTPGVSDGQQVEVVGLPAPHEETPCAGGALHVRTVRHL